MLKLGCMSLSYKDEFAANQLDLEQFIERAYQLGLDGIDIHTRAFTSLDPAYLRRIRMQAFRRGLALSYIGVSSNYGKPQDELAAEVATTKEWIDVAAFMGIPLVRVFAAWIPEGEREEDVWGADDAVLGGSGGARRGKGGGGRLAQPQSRLRHAHGQRRAPHYRGRQ